MPLAGAAGQRRLLALLAVLSVAGEGGLSRDKLLGLFWPEGDPERARHSLTQTLYHARRVLAAPDLFSSTGADVRLDPSQIESDVRDFERTVLAGDLETAARLYEGPFLDGFFLSGAAEFEQWASAQRNRLASQAQAVVERLADRCESGGDYARALEWRRRLVTMAPLDAGASVKLMHTMAAAGDRAGALQHARVHELLMREQLDAPPEPAVVRLASRLRHELDAAATEAPAARPGAAPAAPVAVIDPAPTATEARTADSVAAPSPSPAARPRHAARALLLGAMVLAISAGAIVGSRYLRARDDAIALPTSRRVVVAPFRVTGADPSLAFLRDGMVELLSTRLADDSIARSVDPGAVLGAWRLAGQTSAADMPRAEAVSIAERLGAQHVVVGSVVGGPSALVLSAALVRVPSGTVQAQVSAEGPADSITVLVDRLAARLIAADAGESERLALHTTPAVSALRAYLEGQAAYRRNAYEAAIEHYERALQLDSTFALAALQLALAAGRLNDAEQHDRALALAWAAREELSARDRAHLIAFAGPRYPAPTPESEQLAAWERAAALAPDRADVWHNLGERFFHDGGVLGHERALDRAGAAFRRALSLDPTSEASRRFLILIAARGEDTTTLRGVATPAALRDSLGDYAPSVRWRVALVRRDEEELRRVRESFVRLDNANLRAIAMSAMFDGVGASDAERVLRVRRARATRTTDQVDAVLAQHSLAMLAGRPVLALDLTEQLQEIQPGSRAHLRLRVLDALYAEGDSGAAAAAASELSRGATTTPARQPSARAIQLADLCVIEQWRLGRGETGTIRSSIARLRREGVLRDLVPVATPPLACAELLEASLAVVERRNDARKRVQRLDSLVLAGPAISDATTYAHLVVSRLYARLGQDSLALAAIRRRSYLTGWPRYLGATRLEEARLAARNGDTTAARRAYVRYLSFIRSPEPTVAARVGAARTELEALGGRASTGH